MTLDNIRNKAFWLLDFLKGSKIRRHYLEIKNYHASDNHAIEKAKNIEKIKELLMHTVNTVPYYYSFNPDLEDFPVINKNIIRDNFDLFLSNSFDRNSLYPVVTSGSTGTPFRVYQNKNKKLRNTADTIYFAQKAGFDLGQKLFYLKIWNKINLKNPFNAWIQNVVPQDVTSLSDKRIEEFIERLKSDKKKKNFLGYASAFDAICQYMKKNNSQKVEYNVRSVIAMSEALSDNTKAQMNYYFSAPVVSRYSNVENGIIAQQNIDGSNEFEINIASYVVELLDINKDIPVPLDTPGRIVITDLFNYGMPLIRYDTGDIGIMGEKRVAGVNLMVLKKVEGRKMDMIYDTSRKLVSSFTITNNMWKYDEILQYQFIQLDTSQYKFVLNVNRPFQREKELIEEFKQYFGKDATINVEYVDEIPLLNSGKRKKVLNISEPNKNKSKVSIL